MNEFNFDELSALAYRFKDTADSARDELRKFHEELAADMQKTVRANIIGAGITDNHGKVRGWQEKYVGSYGGYAAVRPRKSTEAEKENKSASSPGAITNYLENGHRIVHVKKAKDGSKSYVENKKRAVGFSFYQLTRREEYAKAKRAAEKLRDRIVKRLGGG